MPQQTVVINSFNRGLISSLGLARTDLDRLPISSVLQNNVFPRILGPMSLRPGFEYIGSSDSDNLAYYIPFIFSNTDFASIELTASLLRVRDETDAIITRPSVSTTVSTSGFGSDTNWTDADESGATSTISGGELRLVGTRYDAAIRHQTLTIAGGDQGVEHGVTVDVTQGPVVIRIGTTQGDDDLFTAATLGTGVHSLAFTPAGANATIQFEGREEYATKVTSCTIESSGAMTIATPWTANDIAKVRYSQSADVVYSACDTIQEKKIVRWDTRSWGVVDYEPEDGPFRAPNTSTVRLTPSAKTGDITLTASRSFFKSTNVGSLFRLTSAGQEVEASLTGADQYTSDIRVVGVGNDRRFTLTISGTWVATVTLQRSFGETGTWVDFKTYTSNQAGITIDDNLDNQIVFYRIGIKTSEYTSGTAEVSLEYTNGGKTGIAKATGFTSDTVMDAIVIEALGGTDATEVWDEGSWSDRRGHMSATMLHESRNCWAGKGRVYLSVKDAFESFDDTTEGDSGPITRTIPGRSVDTINWLLSSTRLLIGTDNGEWAMRSSTLDEPLTPDNANLKSPSKQGSKSAPADMIDTTGLFIQKSGARVYELDFKLEKSDYDSDDISKLIPDYLTAGISRMAVQRQPDTRVYCVLDDGTAAVLVRDKVENVKAWVTLETDGIFEDVFVLPGDVEDRVYFSIQRTIDSSTVRYLEKIALESECVGGTTNKQADSFLIYSGSATATITGLDHLEGEEVIVWGDGVDLSPHDEDTWVQTTYTVSSGQITLGSTVSDAVIGMPYTGRWKSTKLAYGAEDTALNQFKRIGRVGFVAKNIHARGIRYGQDFTDMDTLPLEIDEAAITVDTVTAEFDEQSIDFDGYTDSDPRMCVEFYAPRPTTMLGITIGLDTNEKS